MGIFSRKDKESLDKGLEKTKESVFKKLSRAVVGKSRVDEEVLDNLEEVLITSDVGVETTLNIIERIEDHFEGIKGIKFKIRKLNPPFGGRVDCAAVEIKTGTFDKTELIEGIEKFLKNFEAL